MIVLILKIDLSDLVFEKFLICKIQFLTRLIKIFKIYLFTIAFENLLDVRWLYFALLLN